MQQARIAVQADFDTVIVGAGFAGMYMLHRLRGLGLRARVFEMGDGVGGTWYWNRYPGARCDVESVQYSYQFDDALQQEWDWTERYATQPEILQYANHVADRYDLRRDIRFATMVTSATYDEATHRWTVTAKDNHGDTTTVTAQFVVMATGCLSTTNKPKITGLEDFAGEVYHTGEWPHHPVDFTGKVVGIVGTGSSAIQSVPIVAGQAKHLYVFQRTPNYAVPAHNMPLTPEQKRAVKKNYGALRTRAKASFTGVAFDFNRIPARSVSAEERTAEFERRWAFGGLPFMGAFNDILFDDVANEAAGEFVRDKIRSIVRDPALAEKLTPRDVFGCKRLCVDSGYYETFNRDNVTLVDIRESGIERVTARGVKANGVEVPLDALILATGFDAMTGSLLRVDFRGRGGLPLREKWAGGPRTYLGLMTEHFPNLFTITGPGSPSVLASMIQTIEQHVDWIVDCMTWMRRQGIAAIEPVTAAEDQWVEHVNEVAGKNLRSTCNSWYVGANVPGKPRVFMPYIGGFPNYVDKCNDVAAKGYEGFAFA